MNAKEILQQKLNEADDDLTRGNSPGVPPPGREYPPMDKAGMPHSRPQRRDPRGDFGGGAPHRPGRPDPSGMGDFGGPGSDMERMMGGPGGAPRGQFSPKELSQLKDVVIQMLAHMCHSDLDAGIGEALMNGQPLDPGQLQHIIDEIRNVKLPPSHDALLQRIFDQLKKK